MVGFSLLSRFLPFLADLCQHILQRVRAKATNRVNVHSHKASSMVKTAAEEEGEGEVLEAQQRCMVRQGMWNRMQFILGKRCCRVRPKAPSQTLPVVSFQYAAAYYFSRKSMSVEAIASLVRAPKDL